MSMSTRPWGFKCISTNYCFLLSLSLPVAAGQYDYNCTINFDYQPTKNGELTQNNKIFQGDTFHVDRATGLILGDAITNSSYPNKVVIDKGSMGKQAFKAVWFSNEVYGTNGGRNAEYLTIHEFENATEKPFVYVSGSRVFSGVCK